MFLLRGLNITLPGTHTQRHAESSFSRGDQAGRSVTPTTDQHSLLVLPQSATEELRHGRSELQRSSARETAEKGQEQTFPQPACPTHV